jgi:hypothetical protein
MDRVDYRPVTACLRPPRFVVAYDASEHWVYHARQALGSQTRSNVTRTIFTPSPGCGPADTPIPTSARKGQPRPEGKRVGGRHLLVRRYPVPEPRVGSFENLPPPGGHRVPCLGVA